MILENELVPYTNEKGVLPLSQYLLSDHLIFEQIDNDKVKTGGYFDCIKSLDPKLPLWFSLRSQYLDQSSWREGPLRLIGLDACNEGVNPSRFWYNITKLRTNYPPQKGDKWLIENQIIDFKLDLPPSIPIGKWRFHNLYTQGLYGRVTKFGSMLNMEFVDT